MIFTVIMLILKQKRWSKDICDDGIMQFCLMVIVVVGSGAVQMIWIVHLISNKMQTV